MNISIAGGCFLFQQNVDELYHSMLKTRLQSELQQEVNIDLIRYERLSSCFNKIIISALEANPDILIFHLRAEPFIHLCKLYYKFESENKIEKRINLFIAGMSDADETELKVVHKISNKPRQVNNSLLNLSNLNYIVGVALGNAYFSMKRYLNLIKKINEYCFQKNIRLIVAGAVPRPNNFFEDMLAKKFNAFVMKKLQKENITFVDFMSLFNEDTLSYYCGDLTHVNEKGHKIFADVLTNYIKNTHRIKRISLPIAI
ncbi:MAG TPA: SGNH/GDSL hydrolase family protein [Ignavibacteria bacterium]|nr:SGNH/GDSL hydrolase family protein [Ignavibacteria bacterium]